MENTNVQPQETVVVEPQIVNNSQQAPGTPNDKIPVPKGVVALVFGIVSISTCYSLVIGIVFGILAMSMGGKAVKLYNANPGMYKEGSFKMAKIGKILGLVGLIISGVLALIWIFALIASEM